MSCGGGAGAGWGRVRFLGGAEGFTAPHHHIVTAADEQLHRCEQHLCAHVRAHVNVIRDFSPQRCGCKSMQAIDRACTQFGVGEVVACFPFFEL